MDADGDQRVSRSRRALLLALAAASLEGATGIGRAWARKIAGRPETVVRFKTHEEAVAEGQRRDIGRVEVLAPAPDRTVVAAQYATFQFRYVVGKTPIEPGGFVWFALRHVRQLSSPQANDPAGPGFVKVEGPAGVILDITPEPAEFFNDWFLMAFPWQHPIEIRVKEGRLNPGDTFTVTYGDRSGGGPGARLQAVQEPNFAFRVYVMPKPGDAFMPLAEDLVFPVVGGPVERLALVAPSHGTPGRKLSLLVRAEDRFGNEAVSYAGEVMLRSDDGRELAKVAMMPAMRGLATIEVEPFRTEGVIRFEASDGTRTARSNPVRIGDARAPIYFGDIHGHTLYSDGRGTPRQYYTYARDVARLDFCAITDHDFMLSDEMWADLQATTESFNEPGRFVTIQAYEWSGETNVGGDHNVYFRGTDTMMLRCRSYYDYRNQQTYHGRDPQANHIEDLYNALLRRYPEGEVMVIPHFGGRPANPKWHNPRLEPMIEIFSDHRRSHEWAYSFLKRGYRLGILASSDCHLGRPGNGFLNSPLAVPNLEINTALVAISADSLTRENVFDAIFSRRAYATTGDRILLDVRFGEAGMGEEVSGPATPVLNVEVEGTAPVVAIEVWKDVAPVHKLEANAESVRFAWTDPNPPAVGATSAYWVRVIQANGEEAISSPVWWTRTGA